MRTCLIPSVWLECHDSLETDVDRESRRLGFVHFRSPMRVVWSLVGCCCDLESRTRSFGINFLLPGAPADAHRFGVIKMSYNAKSESRCLRLGGCIQRVQQTPPNAGRDLCSWLQNYDHKSWREHDHLTFRTKSASLVRKKFSHGRIELACWSTCCALARLA